MDLGIAGRRALVCAASKGLGRGCAEALAREGVDVTIVARTEATVARTAEEIGAMAGRKVAWVACDITTVAGRAAALAACPQPDILDQQRRRTSARRFSRLGSRCVVACDRCQHAHADRTHQVHRRWHDRSQVRPHREHHVRRSQGADRRSRTVQRRAQRADRISSRDLRARSRSTTSPSTICCRAISKLIDCAARWTRVRRIRVRRLRKSWRRRVAAYRRDVWQRRGIRRTRARSCAARRRDSWWARTS